MSLKTKFTSGIRSTWTTKISRVTTRKISAEILDLAWLTEGFRFRRGPISLRQRCIASKKPIWEDQLSPSALLAMIGSTASLSIFQRPVVLAGGPGGNWKSILGRAYSPAFLEMRR